jgi:hypothetical protein
MFIIFLHKWSLATVININDLHDTIQPDKKPMGSELTLARGL